MPALDGDYCDDDYDCEMDHICHYESQARLDAGISTCMPMYLLPSDGSHQFGYVGNNDWEGWVYNGRLCQSGFAHLINNPAPNDRQGTCSDLASITVNGAALVAPYECDPTDPTNAAFDC